MERNKDKLDNILLASGYTEDPIVPCVYRHSSYGVTFALVVDDFAVKYNSITGRANYKLSIDATGSKFVASLLITIATNVEWTLVAQAMSRNY